MPGPVPGIHGSAARGVRCAVGGRLMLDAWGPLPPPHRGLPRASVDARDKPGHDDLGWCDSLTGSSTMTISDQDLYWMGAALNLARQALGTVAPNPAVGCVLVKDGIVIGRGRPQPGGRPHAETVALAMAGAAATGATAYVTLEPCNHQGVTGPCSEALIAAGIARAVIACNDPDGRAAGGARRLAQAGVTVATGIRADEAG